MNLICLLNWIWLSEAFFPSLLVGRDLKWSELQAAVAKSLLSGQERWFFFLNINNRDRLFVLCFTDLKINVQGCNRPKHKVVPHQDSVSSASICANPGARPRLACRRGWHTSSLMFSDHPCCCYEVNPIISV